MFSFLKQLFYKKSQSETTTDQIKPTTKTPKMMKEVNNIREFTCKFQQNTKTFKVQLNRLYEIQSDNKFFDTIELLVMLVNEKNEKSNKKYHIKDRFGLNFYSSLEFLLSKCNMDDEKCMVCLSQFQIKNIQTELSEQSDEDIYALPCSHKFHMACLLNLIGKKQWAKCPICSTIFGKMTGDQPQGTMSVSTNKLMKLPGHQNGGTITISYKMQGGIRNGVSFNGTGRTAYLPDTKQGRQVLRLFEQAFNRKLIFTVGRSVTTGLDNQTVWNGIHHKTSTKGGVASFGYPDPTYLDRVKQQLAAKGITLESLDKKHEVFKK